MLQHQIARNLIDDEVHVGPWHTGEAVKPEAAGGGEVRGRDGAKVITVSLGGVEGADDELAGDLKLQARWRPSHGQGRVQCKELKSATSAAWVHVAWITRAWVKGL